MAFDLCQMIENSEHKNQLIAIDDMFLFLASP